MDITTSLYIKHLQNITKDLLFTSESDYPWEVSFLGKDETEMRRTLPFALEQAKQLEAIQLLKNAVRMEDWYEETEIQAVKKYQQLLALLQEAFQQVKVFKFGEIEILVYIIFQLPNNEWLGLKTTSVET